MIFYDNEVPSGLVNGTNSVFTLAASPNPVNSLLLLRNGVVQVKDVDFTISGNTIVFINIPQSGDSLRAWYRIQYGVEGPIPGGLYRDDAVQLIMDRLGMRTGLDTQIIRHMKAVQSMLESKPTLPWFLVRNYSFSTSSQEQAIPQDFIREIDDFDALWIRDSAGNLKSLDKFDYDALATSVSYQGYSEPKAYALYGLSLYLFPAPDKSYDFQLLYFGFDAELSSNIKNSWLTFASRLVVAETGLSTARMLRDYEQSSIFAVEAKEAWADLIRSNTARLQAAVRSTVGDYTT